MFLIIFEYLSKNHLIAILILIISIPIVLFPRFNRNDISIIRPFVGTAEGELSPDMQEYNKFTEYFRGHEALTSIDPPYSYRPLVPFLASILPFDAFLSFNLVNIGAICLSIIIFWLALKKLNFNFEYRIVGVLLSLVSFPVLYYGPSGYIDAFSVMILYLIFYLRVSGKDNLIPIFMIMGAVVKETVIIIVPFLLVDIYFRTDKRERLVKYLYVCTGVFLYLVTTYFVRKEYGTGNQYLWVPEGSAFWNNIIRPKTYLSFLLAFGIPGILSLIYLIKYFKYKIDTEKYSLIIGTLCGLGLFCYAVISAYSDGRFVWTAYPFMIPLALYYFKSKFEVQNLKSSSTNY